MVKIKDISLQYYVDRLKNSEYFSFVRYGNGEWKAVFYTEGRNGYSQMLSQKLRKDMRKSLTENASSHGVIFGMQNLAAKLMGGN